jgi:UDP-N-acetylmuramoyl-tripeptide--D-alanyl-D-alanine ligase
VAGIGEAASIRPDTWSVEANHVTFRRRGVDFRVEAGGEHHLRDALLALAVAEALGVAPEEAAGGLAGFRPLGLRGDLRRVGGLAVLADCYNANPESFEASVRWCVDAFPDRRRAAAVGTMLEMGERSAEAHRGVARLLVREAFDPVAATGAFVEAFSALETGDTRVLASGDAREAGERLAGALAGDEVVLVKGSRGARMERALEELERVHGSDGSIPGATAGDGDGMAGDGDGRRGATG